MNSSLSQDLIGASIVLQVLWWNVIANGGYLFFYSVHLHYREEKRVIEGITLELKGMIFYVYQEVVLSLKLFVKGLLRFAEIQGWDSVTNLVINTMYKPIQMEYRWLCGQSVVLVSQA